jgi:hypothetical protein
MMPRQVPILLLVLSVLAGCGGARSLASRVPANHEIDTWTLDGSPTVADNDTELYNLIDGGAPKYIDRGWVGSVYATYQEGTNMVQVAIHDMGNSANAQALYNFDLPVSHVQIGNLLNAVVDLGLPNAYAAEAYAGQYCIEISIDDRSDSALDTVQRFVLATLNRCE